MASDSSFRNGLLAGLLFMVAAQAVYWLITPAAHPDASAGRYAAVVAQLVIALAGGLWSTRRHRVRTGR